jgi:hypothetical protein
VCVSAAGKTFNVTPPRGAPMNMPPLQQQPPPTHLLRANTPDRGEEEEVVRSPYTTPLKIPAAPEDGWV